MFLVRRFRKRRPSLLWFSRGRGRGNALPDLEILKTLNSQKTCWDIRIATYSHGAATFKEQKQTVIDLRLPSNNSYCETLSRTLSLVDTLRPDIVVSHEEPAAIIAAHTFGLPSIAITDWFWPTNVDSTSWLQHVQQICFLGPSGLFPEPAEAVGKVNYCGFLYRPLAYSKHDRQKAREQLRLDYDAVVTSVVPGAWATEAQFPTFELVAEAFSLLPFPRKHLLWVAGDDWRTLRETSRTFPNVSILSAQEYVERIMVASDLGITKGNRGSVMDFNQLGVPTISLSMHANPIDDIYANAFPMNKLLGISQCTPKQLSGAMVLSLSQHRGNKQNVPASLTCCSAVVDTIENVWAASRNRLNNES